jgi:hypothetical protein
MKQLIIIAFAAITASAQTNTVTIQWNPNTETNLAGYIVAYGTNAGWTTNGQPLFTGPQITSTNFTVANLPSGPSYWFAVQAVDTDSIPSDWSDEVVWRSKRLNKPTGLKRTISVIVKVEVVQ